MEQDHCRDLQSSHLRFFNLHFLTCYSQQKITREYRKYVPFKCHQVQSLQHEMISLLFQQPLNWRWISHLCTGKKTAWVGILWTVVFLHENYWSDHVLRLAPRFIAAGLGSVKLSCFLLPFASKCSCMRFSNWLDFFIAICLQMFLHEVIQLDGL